MLRRSSLVALVLVAICLLFLVVAVFNEARHALWFGIALLFLLAAYFVVLAQNIKSRSPIQTRGGVVDPATSPFLYFAAYGLMVLIGVIAGLVFFTALVLPNM